MQDKRRRVRLAPAAQYLDIAPSTLRRWVRERRLPHFRVGKKLAFSLHDLDRFLDQQRFEATATKVAVGSGDAQAALEPLGEAEPAVRSEGCECF